MSFADLLLEALQSATAEHRVRWSSPIRDLGSGRLAEAFRFDDTPEGEWLHIQAAASAAWELGPSIQVRVVIPVPHLEEAAGYRVANDANRLGLGAVHFDAPSGALVAQQSAVFTGYQADPALAVARRESTLNALAAVFGTARACLQLAGLEAGAARSLLQDFTTFVLARMVRWEAASVAANSHACELLLDGAAPHVIVHVDERGFAAGGVSPDVLDARKLLEGWLRDPSGLDPERAKDLDATLFALEQRTRWALRDAVANPPGAAPLRQLQLLERALAEQPACWGGLAVAADDVRGAWAVGLDIDAAHLPDALVQRLSERFPTDATCRVSPQEYWLTRPAQAQVLPNELLAPLLGGLRRAVPPLA